jgi:hypothetical protein
MSQQATAQALAKMLVEHRDAMVDTLIMQAPAAGSEYETATPDELRPRMSMVVDACIGSIAQHNPALLAGFMQAAAESRLREGYSLESLITLAMFTEGALSDTAEIAFENDPAERAEARQIIRDLIAAAESVLDKMITA